MKKNTLLIGLFTLGLFYFYCQIFSFSNQRTFQIERTYDPSGSTTKTSILLLPVCEKKLEEEESTSTLEEEEDAFVQVNTRHFSLGFKL